MHVLCFIAGFDSPSAESTLSRIQRVLRGVVPPFPIPLEFTTGLLPEVQGGWLFQAPAKPGFRQRLGREEREDLLVLFYGELFGLDDHQAPRIVADTWAAGGPNAVRDLDGCFSAIIVERPARRCTIVSDLIGRRTLRYAAIGGRFVATTHDAALVGTGLVRPTVNMTAVKVAAAFGWSLGGVPLLNETTICEPDSILEFQNGAVTVNRTPRMRSLPPLKEGAKQAEQEVLNTMTDYIRKITAFSASNADEVKVDLTAGLDTRCLLALLVSIVDKKKIVAETVGQSGDLDVIVARRLAKSVGVKHVFNLQDKPDPTKVSANLDVLAFSSNGDTDGKRAITDLFKQAEFNDPTPRFYGTVGEHYRGACYPGGNRRSLVSMTPDDVLKYHVYSWSKLDSLPWKDSESRSEIMSVLEGRHRRYEDLAQAPVDLIDLFYVLERFARYGSYSARASWWAQYFSPFSSATLIKMAFQFPPPIGYGSMLHCKLIRQFLPQAYFVPLVNAARVPALLPYPMVAFRLGTLIQRADTLQTSVRRFFGSPVTGRIATEDTWWAEQIASVLRPMAQDLLLSGESIAPRVLRNNDIEELLASLGSSDNYLSSISTLLTIERWREQIDRAWRLVQSDSV